MDTPLGRIGILIGYDLRFAEAVRVLLLRGAEVMCVPATWTDRDNPEPWDGRGLCGPTYLAAGHAYGNRMWVICADRSGSDGGIQTLGCSAIFTPSGLVAAGPAAPGDSVLTAEISAAAATRGGEDWDLVRDRRPDLYEPPDSADDYLGSARVVALPPHAEIAQQRFLVGGDLRCGSFIRIRPFSITATRSATASAASTCCSTSSMPTPRRRSVVTASRSLSTRAA